MADILIRGMEMPIRCINCPFKTYYHSENRCLANRGKKIVFEIGHDRGRDCPLLPLPEGHGRLIDADYLLSLMDNGDHYPTGLLDAADIYDAPTIIEAEGGGEG